MTPLTNVHMKTLLAGALILSVSAHAGSNGGDHWTALQKVTTFSVTLLYNNVKLEPMLGNRLVVTAELEARKLGLAVRDYKSDESEIPHLCIKVDVGALPKNEATYLCSLQFHRRIRIPFDDGTDLHVKAQVWETGLMGACPMTDLVNVIELTCDMNLKEFLNDFLKANPIPRSGKETTANDNPGVPPKSSGVTEGQQP